MKTKILILFVLIISYASANAQVSDRINKHNPVRAQDDDQTVSRAPVNTVKPGIPFTINLDPGRMSSNVIIGPEILTNISGYYDYKTNGMGVHYIQMFPGNPLKLYAIDMQSNQGEPAGTTTRKVYYSVSTDGGLTWTESPADIVGVKAGYPTLALRGDTAIVANHNGKPSSDPAAPTNANLYVEIDPQSGVFDEYLAPVPPPVGRSIWPQIATLNNGNVIMVARPQSSTTTAQNDSIFYSIWNGTTVGAKQLIYVCTPPYSGDAAFTNAAYNVATNNSGKVGIIINAKLEADVLDEQIIKLFESTNNGQSFGSAIDVFTPYLENNNEDTVAMDGGHDFSYKPNSNKWVYAGSGTADGLFAKTRLFVVRGEGSTVQGTTVIADTLNVPMTREFNQPWAFQNAIDHPVFGWSADGNTLYCVYDVVVPQSDSLLWNTRDIFMSYSTNDGAAWSAPIRITDTPNIDEGFPSISLVNPNNQAHITYMRDPGNGPASFNGTGTLAASTQNDLVYRKLTEIVPVGINNVSNEVPNSFSLQQNYPNPFNPSTVIRFNIAKTSNVTLKVYDLTGKLVATLVNNETVSAGTKEVSFNASQLAAGVYFYSLNAGDFKETKKMMLIK